MTTNEELIAEASRLIADCMTYNFGMHNADKLAHEIAPKLVAALAALTAPPEGDARERLRNVVARGAFEDFADYPLDGENALVERVTDANGHSWMSWDESGKNGTYCRSCGGWAGKVGNRQCSPAPVLPSSGAPQEESVPKSSYISPNLPAQIRGLYRADLREKSIQTMLDLAGDLVQELIDLRAAPVPTSTAPQAPPNLRRIISDALRETYSWSESTQAVYDVMLPLFAAPLPSSGVDEDKLAEVIEQATKSGSLNLIRPRQFRRSHVL